MKEEGIKTLRRENNKNEEEVEEQEEEGIKTLRVFVRVDVGSMQGRCRVDVGSMQGRQEVDVFVDGKMYRIHEEVEVEEGK